ncbi:MAG: NAD(P)H-hydrate dehydratase [bacterium]
MHIVTGNQMALMDKETIENIGIPGVVLMENAGVGVVEHMHAEYGGLQGKRIGICCGGGNNGGDGFVIARHLQNQGVVTDLFLFADTTRIKGDAKINLDILYKMGQKPLMVKEDLSSFLHAIQKDHIIIDALFGTGFKPPIRGFLGKVIETLNNCNKPIVAVDIPSGLSADSPDIFEPSICADMTVTFAFPKIAHSIPPAMQRVGKVRIVDISIPQVVYQKSDAHLELVEASHIAHLFKKRNPFTHKGTYGHCLIIAGSQGKTGAAYLAAQGALRVGAGLVTLAHPHGLTNILSAKLSEAMTLPLPQTDEMTLSVRSWPLIEKVLPAISAVGIGPGISTHAETRELVATIVKNMNKPLVIDADGLNCLVNQLDIISGSEAVPILTPHPGEMARLLGISVSELMGQRLELLNTISKKYKLFITLKGYRTLIANPDGAIMVNPTGNPGMASGGMGDVLTGMITGFLAQGFSRQNAVLSAVFLHGLAGDLAVAAKGESSLLATDVLAFIPEAIRQLKDSHV